MRRKIAGGLLIFNIIFFLVGSFIKKDSLFYYTKEYRVLTHLFIFLGTFFFFFLKDNNKKSNLYIIFFGIFGGLLLSYLKNLTENSMAYFYVVLLYNSLIYSILNSYITKKNKSI